MPRSHVTSWFSKKLKLLDWYCSSSQIGIGLFGRDAIAFLIAFFPAYVAKTIGGNRHTDVFFEDYI